MSEAAGEAGVTPGRGRRVRLAVLLVLLAASGAALGAKRLGYLAFLEAPAFTGRLELGHEARPIVVEQVDLLRPAARLLVARIPRGAGYRLQAVLAGGERPDLETVAALAGRGGALVAVNGDYHRLSGFLRGTPYSTLIDAGQAPGPLGSPFSYAAAFSLDAEGAPRAGRLDLRVDLRLPGGEVVAAFRNLQDGDVLLIDRPPVGAWSPVGDHRGLPLEPAGDGAWRVAGAATRALVGAALLVAPDAAARAALEGLAPGARLEVAPAGEDADRVRLVLGTGPLLVTGGQARVEALAAVDLPGWRGLYWRTAVGYDAEHVLLVSTVWTRRGALSMVDLARALEALGCEAAVNLDGGPSATLWAGGRVLNALADDPEAEGDVVGSALLVLPPDAEAGTPVR